MRLRDYQQLAVNHAVDALQRENRTLYAAPTGTGKSVIELAVQAAVPGSWIVTPRVEIVRGLLEKAGGEVPESETALWRAAESNRIATPVRFRNVLLSGGRSAPSALIMDECHHDAAETYQQIHTMSQCPAVGFTATPYRGTPRGTAKLLEQWGEPVWIITLRESVEGGWLAFPTVRVEPLIDDDVITVSNGEFVVEAVTRSVASRLDDVVHLAGQWCHSSWDRPTMYAVPSTEIARELAARLTAAGLPAVYVVADTPYSARQRAFSECLSGRAALVQIGVVSEGVDLPFRRLVDLSPTLSPVRWLQQLGRITRPTDVAPEYVCCNRNLLRHAYLLEGLLPPAVLSEATAAFGGPGKYATLRAVGLEALGRFKAAELPLADGNVGLAYTLASTDGGTITQYACLVHPLREETLWAQRDNRYVGQDVDGKRKYNYGRWVRCAAPEDVCGFASVPPSPLSDKQKAWWARSAARHGLDGSAKVNRKSFAALPVLADLRCKI